MATQEEYEALLTKVKSRCEASSQSHILQYITADEGENSKLSLEDKLSFLKSVDDIPLEKLAGFLEGALEEEKKLSGDKDKPQDKEEEEEEVIEPFTGTSISTTTTDPTLQSQLQSAYTTGLDAIKQGQVAALLLAGGQGTRLGYNGPKGMYDIGLPSGRSLFQLIAERVKKLGHLVADNGSGGDGGNPDKQVPLYVMTSPMNHEQTVGYFKEKDDFGIDVTFFPQGTLPAVTPDGKMILETPTKLATAPDGNGGIYPALLKHSILSDMKSRGIQYIHVFGVDNALVKPADPTFCGYCIQNGADCGNKALWKVDPGEKVGVMASKRVKSKMSAEERSYKRKKSQEGEPIPVTNNEEEGESKPCIIEYSDMSPEMKERRGPDGRLVFGAGNICNHFYTLEFLTDVVVPSYVNGSALYHVARKKIPYWDGGKGEGGETVKPGENNGIKLESFIFDVFPLAKKMTVLDVCREEEFAPVKNPEGSGNDSPDTARELFGNVAKSWLTKAGATLVEKEEQTNGDGKKVVCEVAPMTSYGGEGLEKYKGESLECPFSI